MRNKKACGRVILGAIALSVMLAGCGEVQNTESFAEKTECSVSATKSEEQVSVEKESAAETKESAADSETLYLDFADPEPFEIYLNLGKDLTGMIVRMPALSIHPDSVYGYNVWAGEHLNLIFSEDIGAKEGDILTVKVTEAKESEHRSGSWVVYCEQISGAVEGPGTIYKAEGAGKSEAVEVTMEKQVLVDQKDVVITATGMDEGLFGPELKLLIENNSDTDLCFQVRNASVNGFMVDTSLSEDVSAGKKSNARISFSRSDVTRSNITTFANIEFSFHIFTQDKWKDYLDTELITVKTSVSESYEQPIDKVGVVMYDDKDIKIVAKHMDYEESFMGPGVIMYVENNSDTDITVQVKEMSVNGFMVDHTMSTDILAGKKAMTSATIFSSSLEENEIEEIDEIDIAFHIIRMDNWQKIVDTESVTLTLN